MIEKQSILYNLDSNLGGAVYEKNKDTSANYRAIYGG